MTTTADRAVVDAYPLTPTQAGMLAWGKYASSRPLP